MDYSEESKSETPKKKHIGSISCVICVSFNQDRVKLILLLLQVRVELVSEPT